MAQQRRAKSPKTGSRSGTGLFVAMVLGVVALGCVLPASLPRLAVGVIPSATALVTDRDPHRALLRTVLPLNLAGVMIYVVALWRGDHSFAAAIEMLRMPITWVVMFAAAGIGSLLHVTLPVVVTLFLRDRLNRRRAAEEKLIADMKTEWGPEVSPDDPEGSP
jgi:hypothetical protein